MPWLQVITLSCGRPRARVVDPVEKLHGPRLPSAPPWVRPLRRIIDTDLDGIDGAFRHLSIGLRGEPGADHWLAGAVCAAGQTTQAHRPPVRGCRAAIHSVDRAFYDALSTRASPQPRWPQTPSDAHWLARMGRCGMASLLYRTDTVISPIRSSTIPASRGGRASCLGDRRIWFEPSLFVADQMGYKRLCNRPNYPLPLSPPARRK